MGIFSIVKRWLLRASFVQAPQDAVLDWYIADALNDEAQVPVPPGAWNRLKLAITERHIVNGYGMWVLDQVNHDPPESIPAVLSDAQLARALHIQNTRHAERRWTVGHPSLGGVSPTFIAVFTL